MQNEIFEKVVNVVAEQLGRGSEITMETDFRDDLETDSLDNLGVALAIEEEFGIELSDEEAEKIRTVGDVVRIIIEHGRM